MYRWGRGQISLESKSESRHLDRDDLLHLLPMKDNVQLSILLTIFWLNYWMSYDNNQK